MHIEHFKKVLRCYTCERQRASTSHMGTSSSEDEEDADVGEEDMEGLELELGL